MTKKLIVYGGLRFKSDGKQHRIVIATTSRKNLASLLDVGMGSIHRWWSTTGNEKEIVKALEAPETLVDMGVI